MNKLPRTDGSLLLRTDFADEAAWLSLAAAVRAPAGEFQAYVDCVSDRSYEGITLEQLIELAGVDGDRHFVFVADRIALTHRDQPVLVVDLLDQPGRTFRVVPSEAWGVENNLSIANMGFEEFADAVDADGVFRGFPEG